MLELVSDNKAKKRRTWGTRLEERERKARNLPANICPVCYNLAHRRASPKCYGCLKPFIEENYVKEYEQRKSTYNIY